MMRKRVQSHIRYILHAVYILVTIACGEVVFADSSKISRAPASFVPDDDIIEVPMVYEKSFFDRLHEDNRRDFANSRKVVENWQLDRAEASAYGLENSGIYALPTLEQRQNFMQRNYMRFISTRVQVSANQGVVNAWQRWTTNDEIDSLEKYEEHEEYIIKAKKDRGGSVKMDKSKEVKVGAEEFKIDFQPRLEMGMVKIKMTSRFFKLKAWVGVNGNQEVQAERNFSATNTLFRGRYYIDQGRVLASMDQRITDNWSLRVSHDRYLEESISFDQLQDTEINIVQLRFGMGF